VGDGVTFDTEAIQKAIDACAGSGGTVYLTGGKFLTAPLVLKGGMTFYINKDAVLLGSTRSEDYPDLVPPQTEAKANRKSLLYAYEANHLVLDGEGQIDGQGQRLLMTGKEQFRPSLLRIYGSTGVTVRNLTLRNPRMWTQVYSECSHLTLDHLKVFSPKGYCPNLDGMDICDCDHVTVSNCRVESQDDAICLKSHGSRGLQYITVKNNDIINFDANGIKLGTATNGPINHLLFENNVIERAGLGGICLESVDGAHVNDITVRGLDMKHVSQPIFIRLALRVSDNPQFASMKRDGAGAMNNIVIENVRVLDPNNTEFPSNTITGIPGASVGTVMIRNCYIEMPGGIATIPAIPAEHAAEYPQSKVLGYVPGYAFYVRHADDVTFDHVTVKCLTPDRRPWLAKNAATVHTISCTDLMPIANSNSTK
jgi:polygalacturonase